MDINAEIQKIWPEKLHCYTEEEVNRYSFDDETKEYLLNIGVPIWTNGKPVGRTCFKEQLSDRTLNGDTAVYIANINERDSMTFLLDCKNNEIYFKSIDTPLKCNKNIACFVYSIIIDCFCSDYANQHPRENQKNYVKFKKNFDYLRGIDETVAVKDSYWCNMYMEYLENTMATEEFDDAMNKALAEGRFPDYWEGLYQILLGGMDVLYKTPPEAKESWTLEKEE